MGVRCVSGNDKMPESEPAFTSAPLAERTLHRRAVIWEMPVVNYAGREPIQPGGGSCFNAGVTRLSAVFPYVIEGEYKWAIDDNKAKVLKAGDTFYEPTGCLHRVSKNPSDKNKTRVLAFVLHPQDVKDMVIPEKKD